MNPVFEITGPAGLFWAPSAAALPVVLALLVMLALTVQRAWRRLDGRSQLRRWLVTILNIGAFAAVALLVAPPERLQQNNQQALLLTPGATTGELPGNRPLFSLPGVEVTQSAIRVQELSLPGQLMLRLPGLASLEVQGHGLSAEEWGQLPPGLSVRFDPPPLSGPVDMQWSRRLNAGEPLRVAGRVSLANDRGVVRLSLLDPAGLPVTEVSARPGQSFELQAVPKATGRMTYQLQAWRGDMLISQSPVGIDVQDNRGARLLVLQSAPSFDTSQLVNWVAGRGQQAVVLTQISADRDLTQGFNTPDQMSLSLDSELLRWADLVMMDGRRWAGLAAVQRQRVLDEVRRGAGLLLLADAELADWLDNPQNDALAFALQAAEPDRLAWPIWPGGTPASPLPTAPWQFADSETHTLTGSEEGPVLEAWQALGDGRVAISLLSGQQRWFTEGQLGNATRYWSYVMRALARPDPGPEWLAPASREIVRSGRMFTFCIASTQPAAYLIETPAGDFSRGELVRHADGFPVACGWARATQEGWYAVKLDRPDISQDSAGSRALSVRVYGEQDWLENEYAQRQSATLARADGSQEATIEALVSVRSRAFSPWWPYALLLFAAGVLWLERRLFDLG